MCSLLRFCPCALHVCVYRRVFMWPVFVDGAWFWPTADSEMRVKEHETWNNQKRKPKASTA